MWASIIVGLIGLATTITTSVIQNNEKKKAMNQARGIADMNRADALRQQAADVNYAKKQQRLRDQQLSFSEKMFKEQSKDKMNDLNYESNKANDSFILAGADKMFGKTSPSMLFARKTVGQYA